MSAFGALLLIALLYQAFRPTPDVDEKYKGEDHDEYFEERRSYARGVLVFGVVATFVVFLIILAAASA